MSFSSCAPQPGLPAQLARDALTVLLTQKQRRMQVASVVWAAAANHLLGAQMVATAKQQLTPYLYRSAFKGPVVIINRYV